MPRRSRRTLRPTSTCPRERGQQALDHVSQQAGKSNLLAALARHNIALGKDDPRLERLLREKERARGYSYDGADASFFHPRPHHPRHAAGIFHIESYRASVERRYNARGEEITVTDAVVKIRVGDEIC